VVSWQVTGAGASLKERDSRNYAALEVACGKQAWAAAHVLLDCGVRVDTQGGPEEWWPVPVCCRRCEL
jgi:hypothetical protein